MSPFPLYAAAVIIFFANATYAQVIDNTVSYRIVNAASYLKVHYENDYFSSKDRDYTQGINLEFVHPALKKNPINYLLLKLKNESIVYTIAAEHNAYTPAHIDMGTIQYGDRPFAAGIMLKSMAASSDADKRYRVTSSFTIGMIGPVAGAEEMQRGIHRWINDTAPIGWQYQIKNDLILNYEAAIEKNVYHSGFLLINYITGARLGTLSSRFTAGGVIMIGKLNGAITTAFAHETTHEKKSFYFHFYAHPYINTILHDATLQGGVFNRHNPYTLSAKELERITIGGNLGLNLTYKAVNVEYFQNVLSQEFATGRPHWWGGLRTGVMF
jgi:lipid A 3-O-deacylase